MSTIVYKSDSYPAEECRRCGTKIFPPSLMQAHTDRHAAKDAAFEFIRADTAKRINGMRFDRGWSRLK